MRCRLRDSHGIPRMSCAEPRHAAAALARAADAERSASQRSAEQLARGDHP